MTTTAKPIWEIEIEEKPKVVEVPKKIEVNEPVKVPQKV